MIRACCPCFFRNQVPAKHQRNKVETAVVVAQPGISPTAPPLDAVVVDGTNLSDITTQMQLQTDESLRRNEELYAQQLLRQNQLSQIVDAKHQGTMAQMRQMTQFAETDKQNRSTQGILDQARQAELEALQKRHQDALLPGNTQKKTPI